MYQNKRLAGFYTEEYARSGEIALVEFARQE